MALKQHAIAFLTEGCADTRKLILEDAKELAQSIRIDKPAAMLRQVGVSYFAGVNSSAKIIKGAKLDYLTMVLYLSASNNAGVEVCPFACLGCREACLVGSGHALLEKRAGKLDIASSRVAKTWLAVWNPAVTNALLDYEIKKHKRAAGRKGMRFAARLNGTSDLEWRDIMLAHPDVQFYDYTKRPTVMPLPNHHITFSFSTLSPSRMEHYRKALHNGQRIAVPVIASDVERCLALPDTFDMDGTDLRFLDEGPAMFGILKAKKTDKTMVGVEKGFILDYYGVTRLISALW